MKTTKKEARLSGDTYYFTGKPCKHGHISKRVTVSGNCYSCQQEASNRCYHNAKKDMNKRKTQILTRIKQRANRNGIDFDLTVDDIEWNTHCPVFGFVLSYDCADKDRSPSLDKIDPNGGYVKGNVTVMSLRANRAKWNMNLTESKKLYEYFLSISQCK